MKHYCHLRKQVIHNSSEMNADNIDMKCDISNTSNFTRHYADPITYNSKKHYDKNKNFARDFK